MLFSKSSPSPLPLAPAAGSFPCGASCWRSKTPSTQADLLPKDWGEAELCKPAGPRYGGDMTPDRPIAPDLQGKRPPEVAAFILNTCSISSTHQAHLPYQLQASQHTHSPPKGGQAPAGHGPTMAGGLSPVFGPAVRARWGKLVLIVLKTSIFTI